MPRAPRKTGLALVKPGDPMPEPEQPKRPQTLEEAAKSGTHRDLLVAMRDRIATAVQDPNCPPRDLAALTRRLNEIAKDIRALDLAAKQEADEEVPADDEIDAASI